MFAIRRATIAAFIASTLTVPFAGIAGAAPGDVCYFDNCAPKKTASAAPASAPTPPSQKIWVLGEHGSWVVKTDGSIVMIIDRFPDGARFGIADMGDHWRLMVSSPSWSLTVGREYSMKIEVDGEIYSGNAFADDGTTLVLDKTSEEFIKAVYSGRKALITTVNDTFTTALPDASAALDDIATYQKTSSR